MRVNTRGGTASSTSVRIPGLFTILLAAILSSVIATAAGLLVMVVTAWDHGVPASAADVLGFGFLAGVSAAILSLALYTPALTIARRRALNAAPAVLLCAVALNVPVFLVLGVGLTRGMYGGFSEALLFAVTYAVNGALFASLFVRFSRVHAP